MKKKTEIARMKLKSQSTLCATVETWGGIQKLPSSGVRRHRDPCQKHLCQIESRHAAVSFISLSVLFFRLHSRSQNSRERQPRIDAVAPPPTRMMFIATGV